MSKREREEERKRPLIRAAIFEKMGIIIIIISAHCSCLIGGHYYTYIII